MLRAESKIISTQDFIEAAKQGNLKFLNQYIAANKNNPDALNAASEDGCTALMLVVNFDHIDAFNALLAVPGINVNATDKYGATALMFATGHNRTQMVHALLSRPDIIVNATDQSCGNTALLWAVQSNHTNRRADTILTLLAHPNIDINVNNKFGESVGKSMFLSFAKLPPELQIEIIRNLKVRDLGRMTRVSKQFKTLSENAEIWKSLIACDFKRELSEINRLQQEQDLPYKNLYQYLLNEKEINNCLQKQKIEATTRPYLRGCTHVGQVLAILHLIDVDGKQKNPEDAVATVKGLTYDQACAVVLYDLTREDALSFNRTQLEALAEFKCLRPEHLRGCGSWFNSENHIKALRTLFNLSVDAVAAMNYIRGLNSVELFGIAVGFPRSAIIGLTEEQQNVLFKKALFPAEMRSNVIRDLIFSINYLPANTLLIIFANLNLISLTKVNQVCKRWYQLSLFGKLHVSQLPAYYPQWDDKPAMELFDPQLQP